MGNNQQKHSYLLPASILIAAVLISGTLIYTVGSSDPSGNPDDGSVADVDILEVLEEASKDSVVLGDPDAPVRIVEFADFQCPFCGKFHRESGDKIREEYIETGKVSMVYLDLAFLGQESVQAALATHCAGDQGKFWTYHDYLYNYLWDNYYAKNQNGENVGAYSDDNLKKFAEELGLETKEFNECLDSQKHLSKVDAGREAAEAVLGQRISTPSVFVGDQLIQGAQPYEVFKAAIEKQL